MEEKTNMITSFLEKMGLKDPKSRKYAIIGFILAIALITVFMLDAIQKRAPAENIPESGSMFIDLPEIEEGTDDSSLKGSGSSLLGFYNDTEKRSRAGDFARRIWDDTGRRMDDQSIEDDLNLRPDTTRKDNPSGFGDRSASIDDKIRTAFEMGKASAPAGTPPPSSPGYASVPSSPSSGGGYYSGPPSSSSMTDSQRAAARRQAIINMGYNPDTGLPLEQSPLTPQAPAKEDKGKEKADEPKGPDMPSSSITIKGRGDMSSFGEMSANDDGFSSFGAKPAATAAVDKPYFKVAFAYSDKVRSGDRVSLRLKERLNIDGYDIPLNSIIFATCQINEQRLLLHVSNIDLNGKQYTLNYDAFDVDWEDGLYCPSSSSGETTKQLTDDATNLASSAVSGVVGSYAGRLISSATSIFGNLSRKKEASVVVSEGYEFYLMPARKK